jgi:hypothetical protein
LTATGGTGASSSSDPKKAYLYDTGRFNQPQWGLGA